MQNNVVRETFFFNSSSRVVLHKLSFFVLVTNMLCLVTIISGGQKVTLKKVELGALQFVRKERKCLSITIVNDLFVCVHYVERMLLQN